LKRLVLAPRAQRDLDDIVAYSKQQWGEAQAKRYLERIMDVTERLSAGTFPGRPADDIRQGYRKVRAGSHVFYYRDAEAAIVVVRVLHQSMDAPRHLR
jgi:toxin ParE1/3/4